MDNDSMERFSIHYDNLRGESSLHLFFKQGRLTYVTREGESANGKEGRQKAQLRGKSGTGFSQQRWERKKYASDHADQVPR